MRTHHPLPLKDSGIAYVLLAMTILGFAGLQHFYLGRPVRGVIWFLTWGLVGIGSVYDLLTMKRQVRRVNDRRLRGID